MAIRAIFTWLFFVANSFVEISQAQITLDGSLGPGGSLNGPNFTISSNLGQVRGGNLFHNFGLFNVLTGESASFIGPSFYQ
jgi:large exoprotein involved in heme utilization and adhesion